MIATIGCFCAEILRFARAVRVMACWLRCHPGMRARLDRNAECARSWQHAVSQRQRANGFAAAVHKCGCCTTAAVLHRGGVRWDQRLGALHSGGKGEQLNRRTVCCVARCALRGQWRGAVRCCGWPPRHAWCRNGRPTRHHLGDVAVACCHQHSTGAATIGAPTRRRCNVAACQCAVIAVEVGRRHSHTICRGRITYSEFNTAAALQWSSVDGGMHTRMPSTAPSA